MIVQTINFLQPSKRDNIHLRIVHSVLESLHGNKVKGHISCAYRQQITYARVPRQFPKNDASISLHVCKIMYTRALSSFELENEGDISDFVDL